MIMSVYEDEVEADLANDDKWLRFRFRLGLWPPDKKYYQIHTEIGQVSKGK